MEKETKIKIGDTIISRVLGEHNDDNEEYAEVIEFCGVNDEEIVVEDCNGYTISLTRDEIDFVEKK